MARYDATWVAKGHRSTSFLKFVSSTLILYNEYSTSNPNKKLYRQRNYMRICRIFLFVYPWRRQYNRNTFCWSFSYPNYLKNLKFLPKHCVSNGVCVIYMICVLLTHGAFKILLQFLDKIWSWYSVKYRTSSGSLWVYLVCGMSNLGYSVISFVMHCATRPVNSSRSSELGHH